MAVPEAGSEREGSRPDATPPRGTHRDSAHALLDSPVRRQIVDLLANLPAPVDGPPTGLSARELADRLDLHVTTVRFHLDQLVRAHVLQAEFRAGRVGRPRKIYRFRPGALAGPTTQHAFQALTEVLTESWPTGPDEPGLEPEEAGRRWALRHADTRYYRDLPADSPGAWIGRVGGTVDLLAQWGYSPELRTTDGGRTVELTLVDCPFLSAATSRPDVVCAVHRGLLRGAMEAVGEPDVDVTLHPFVGPRTCVAHLYRRAGKEAP